MQKKSLSAKLQPYARPSLMGAGASLFIVLISIALNSRNFFAFFSLEGLMIVGGGVIAVAFMSFDADDVQKALDAIKAMLKKSRMTHENLRNDITAIIYCARLLRQKGMRNLETALGKYSIKDPFVRYGLNMVVSEYSSEEVRAMMETAADAAYERETAPVHVLQAMASHAPAFGMVGTLVGMVAMLCTLNENVSGIGSSLAVSFLSTLYGVISARMIYIPAASKLKHEIENRRFRNQLIIEGMVMLVNNKTPMYIQDRLNSFLKPETHDYFNVVSVGQQGQPQVAVAA